MTSYADVKVLLWKLDASVFVTQFSERVHKLCYAYSGIILQTILLLQLLLQFDELVWLNQLEQTQLLQDIFFEIFNKDNLSFTAFSVDWHLLSDVKQCSICKLHDEVQIRKFFRFINLSLQLLVSKFLWYGVWLYSLCLNNLSLCLWLSHFLGLLHFLSLRAKGPL